MIRYHDEEWGNPVHDDRKLHEFMILDSFQAGLSWRIILHKRQNFEAAFGHFVPEVVAAMSSRDVERLMNDAGIVRNRRKIEATVANARLVLQIQRQFGSLDNYLWNMVKGKPIVNHPTTDSAIASTSPESNFMSRELRLIGFRFFGPAVCYAFMQGAGLVNDHLVTCFRYEELLETN
jgi:DNA-3-methyladenine glycosylase I